MLPFSEADVLITAQYVDGALILQDTNVQHAGKIQTNGITVKGIYLVGIQLLKSNIDLSQVALIQDDYRGKCERVSFKLYSSFKIDVIVRIEKCLIMGI